MKNLKKFSNLEKFILSRIPELIYAGMFASSISNIFRSMDGGETWQDITYNLARIGGTLKVNPHTGELFRESLYGTWILPAPYKEIPEPEIPEFDMGIYLPDDTIQLKQGDVMTLIPEVTNACLSDRTLRWQSEDTNIIQVNNTGKIDALAAGSCRI
jgi:hypothetical protein